MTDEPQLPDVVEPAPEGTGQSTDMPASEYGQNLGRILDIDLPLAVRFGATEMTLEALTQLSPGSVIDLLRAPDDVVDVLVHGKLVARGEVVVVGGNYGVRITDIMSPAERISGWGA